MLYKAKHNQYNKYIKKKKTITLLLTLKEIPDSCGNPNLAPESAPGSMPLTTLLGFISTSDLDTNVTWAWFSVIGGKYSGALLHPKNIK